MESPVINLNRSSGSPRERSSRHRRRAGGPQFVSACLHGLALPRKGSCVHVTKIATWTLEWWPHWRQRELYDVLEAGAVRFWPTANGFEMCQLGLRFDRYFVVVRRDPDRISIEGLLSQLPVWEEH